MKHTTVIRKLFLTISPRYTSLIVLAFLFQSLSSVIYAVEFTATVNRFTLGEGESLELRLQIDESSLLKKPNYSPLEKDFDIINVGRSSQVRIINGDTKSSTIWKLILIPKTTGQIIIPPLRLGRLKTQPITINVALASTQSSKLLQTQPQIMVEAVVDKTSPYVQEQMLYTVRLLFQGIQIRQWNLSEPKVDDALIHPLGEPVQYDKNIGGITYGVLEKRYAIFPQSSGELRISPITFSGVISDGKRNYIGRGQQIIKRSQAIDITVQPKNSTFPNINWLPAKALQLEEHWSPELNDLKVGESVTWTIVTKALGQSSATLPPLNIKFPTEFKTYPDQAKLEEGQNADGLIGRRSESIAIIATTSGAFTLPAVEISWWNTQTNQLQTSKIPGRSITVIAAAPQKQASPSLPSLAAPRIAATPQALLEIPINDAELLKELKQWKTGALLSSALLLLILAINMVLWIRRNTTKQVATSENILSQKERQQQIRSQLKNVLAACKTNDPKQAQAALLDWFSSLQRRRLHSIGQVKAEMTNPALKEELGKLESLLYSAQLGAQSWDGAGLAELVRNHSATQPKTNKEKEILTPLYPSA
ncbi:MAG: protein BatD [Pseudomonadales bacterium]|nr:protein BatD [Pseudomonadales bacterium]